MYINTKLILEKGYIEDDLKVLQLIHQNRVNDESDAIVRNITDRQMELFYENGLMDDIKGTKKQNEFQKMRLSTKGHKLLEDFQTPEITQGDIEMYDYLCNMYLSHEDDERIIGNKKKTKIYCAIFRNRMALTLKEMYWLCWIFLKEYPFTKKLENIFFDSNKRRYGKFENHFEDSPLYQYLDENRKKVENLWKNKIEGWK